MVCDRHGVFLIEVNSNDIPVPAHTSAEILRVEVDFGTTRVPLEGFVATVTQVLGPCYTRDSDYEKRKNFKQEMIDDLRLWM